MANQRWGNRIAGDILRGGIRGLGFSGLIVAGGIRIILVRYRRA